METSFKINYRILKQLTINIKFLKKTRNTLWYKAGKRNREEFYRVGLRFTWGRFEGEAGRYKLCCSRSLITDTAVDSRWNNSSSLWRFLLCLSKACLPVRTKHDHKVPPFQRRKGSDMVKPPPGCWLVTPGNGAGSGAQCWSLALSRARSSCSQVSLREESPSCWAHTRLPSLPPRPLCSWAHRARRDGQGERLMTHSTVILSAWLLNSFLLC